METTRAKASACIHLQCTRSGKACRHAVHKLGTDIDTCVHFQAVSKLGHSNFYSSGILFGDAKFFINGNLISNRHFLLQLCKYGLALALVTWPIIIISQRGIELESTHTELNILS